MHLNLHLNRRVRFQLAFFSVITLVGGGTLLIGYVGLPNLLFGIGHYDVTMKLPAAGGLYSNANVTYRGTEVGRVRAVELNDTGVDAVLSLKSDIDIPTDLDAAVHSQTAVGEQFVELVPRSGNGPSLKAKQVQSTSVGTVTQAAVESSTDNDAQVLVAVSVKTMKAGAPEQAPRAWRMRISVQKVGDEAKVANVEFVP